MKLGTLFCLSMMAYEVVLAQDHISDFSWLIGTWEMSKPNGNLRLETWSQKDANTLIGKGSKVTGSDTTELESLALISDSEHCWYIPTVPDQNNAKPIPFRLVASADQRYVFENPEHDFPQRIVYTFHPLIKTEKPSFSTGDTMKVDVVDLKGEGNHFRFTRKK